MMSCAWYSTNGLDRSDLRKGPKFVRTDNNDNIIHNTTTQRWVRVEKKPKDKVSVADSLNVEPASQCEQKSKSRCRRPTTDRINDYATIEQK